jgi:hypothetical protein
VAAIVEHGATIGLRPGGRLLATHEGEKLFAVAGGTAEADAFYGPELVDTLWPAASYLFEVGVMQNDVGRDLLVPRLVTAPRPQALEEPRVVRDGGGDGGTVESSIAPGAW